MIDKNTDLRHFFSEPVPPEEIERFRQICIETGLDPFLKQIHAVKRYADGKSRWAYEPSIDGFRSIAESSGKYDGGQIFWCGQDGEWREVWLESEPPAAAKAVVWRLGCSSPFVAIARFDSYKGVKRDGSLNSFWQKMPDLMIGKVAEALALRKAFPRSLRGLYSHEEMDNSISTEMPEPRNVTDWLLARRRQSESISTEMPEPRNVTAYANTNGNNTPTEKPVKAATAIAAATEEEDLGFIEMRKRQLGKEISEIRQKLGYDQEAVRDIMRDMFGVASFNILSITQAQSLLDSLKQELSDKAGVAVEAAHVESPAAALFPPN